MRKKLFKGVLLCYNGTMEGKVTYSILTTPSIQTLLWNSVYTEIKIISLSSAIHTHNNIEQLQNLTAV